jgi:hypothetical protein
MISNYSFRAIVLCLMLVSGIAASAQIDLPAPSPLGSVTQKVGFADITITYSRPSSKGRVVFGDVVPFNKVWRTGANAATKISFSEAVKINGKDVKAGEYSIFTVPAKDKWVIAFNTDLKASAGTYKEENDVLRIVVDAKPVNDFVETLTFNFTNLKSGEATVQLVWEKTSVSFTIVTEVDAVVMDKIKTQTAGVSPSVYFASARYYYDTNRDLTQALEWINLAFAAQEPTFWMLRQKALIQAGLKDYKGAIATAELSTKKAIEAKNDDYVKMNTASIEEWKKMK